VTQRLQVVRLEDLQHLEHGDALAVRPQLPHTVTFERGGDRLDPLRTVLAEVVRRQVATEGADALRDPVAELAAVQRSRSLLGDEAKRARQVGVPEPFAGPRGPPVIDEIGRARALVLPELGYLGA